MRVPFLPLFLLGGLVAVPAHADLYRWVDPQSGSVKYSSVPPPWYGDAGRERASPAVEVLPYRLPGSAMDRPGESARSKDTPAGALEARWRAFLQAFSALAASNDFERAGRAIEQQLEAYQGLVAELDRLDPAGRKRRQAEEAAVLEKLKK